MAVLNQRLPGFVVSIKDGGLQPVVTVPTTETLLIIGNALDGPVNQPYNVTNLTDAEYVFGPLVYQNDYINPITGLADGSNADNNLLKAVYEALQGNAGNILCVRVGGTQAVQTATLSASITVSALYPGRIYNSVVMTVSSGASGYFAQVTQPPSKGGTISWTFANTTTLGNFCSTINNDSRNQSISLSVPFIFVNNLITTLGVGTVYLSGSVAGTNGTGAPGEDYYANKSGYYTALTQSDGTFDQIVDTVFDVANLVGIYGDDQVTNDGTATTTTVAQAFGVFLYNVYTEAQPCVGTLGLKPSGLRAISDLTNFVNATYLNTQAGFYNPPGTTGGSARWLNFGYFMNNGFSYQDPYTGNTVDIGRLLQIVAGPDIILYQSDLGYYVENGSSVYGGLITSLPSQNATTNQILGSVSSLGGNFSKNIHQQLNQGLGYNPPQRNAGSSAYVTFKASPSVGSPIVVSDNTCAQRTSDYANLQVLRIVNVATSVVENVCRPFIGGPGGQNAKSAMTTQINTALNQLVDAGALAGGGAGYNFVISMDGIATLLNTATITLILKPALEIRYIYVQVSVSQ